jgi:hypothetical protein
MMKMNKTDAQPLAQWITENLSGPYACLKGGKAVRPAVQASVSVMETFTGESPDRILQRVDTFLVRA